MGLFDFLGGGGDFETMLESHHNNIYEGTPNRHHASWSHEGSSSLGPSSSIALIVVSSQQSQVLLDLLR